MKSHPPTREAHEKRSQRRGKYDIIPITHSLPAGSVLGYHEHHGNGECGPFIDFMLDKILRTLKAKGEAYEIGGKSRDKSRDKSREKSRDKILKLLKSQPQLTQADLADAIGLSVKAVEKAIAQLKDANRLRRKGGKKFGEWEVV